MANEALEVAWEQRQKDRARLERIRRYYKGEHDVPYMPKGASAEYKSLIKKAVHNWLPMVPTVVNQNLFVEGYRNPTEAAQGNRSDTTLAWDAWIANNMESRQSAVHNGTLIYGSHYVTVLPGSPLAVVRQASAIDMTAVFADEDDDFPVIAARFSKAFFQGKMWRQVEIYDDVAITTYLGDLSEITVDLDGFFEHKRAEHNLGVCPVVRFRNEYPDSSEDYVRGEIEPYIPIQDRLNETVLDLLMAQTYGAYIQKWVTGYAIPDDPETGEPVEPFKAMVDRMFVADDPETKFGNFEQTDLTGFLASIEAAVKHFSATAQVPPHYLLGAMANLSADALTAAETGLARKVAQRKSLFGVSWNSVLRLASIASGEKPDLDASVVWRDTEARSISATVDAYGKLATMLAVPVQALWEKIPGVTNDDVKAWMILKEKADKEAQEAEKAAINASRVGANKPQEGKVNV